MLFSLWVYAMVNGCHNKGSFVDRFSCYQEALYNIINTSAANVYQKIPAYDFFDSWRVLSLLMGGNHHKKLQTLIEDDLSRWILSQQNRTVTPESLFNYSLSQCSGNIYCALATSYNVLENGNKNAMRNDSLLQQKLVIIRESDNFGAYYHFFGAALCAYLFGGGVANTAYYTRYALRLISAINTPPGTRETIDNDEFWIDKKGYQLGKDLRYFLGEEKEDPDDRIYFNEAIGQAFMTM